MLTKCNIKFTTLERTGRNKWVITFDNRSAANEAIDNHLIKESKFSINIPWYLLYRKVIIKGIPEDYDIEEVTNELKTGNPNIIFEEITRMKRRMRNNDSSAPTYIESSSVKVNIRSQTIPSWVFLWRIRLAVVPFISGIRQCFRCGALGHSSNFCKGPERCLSSGRDRHHGQGCTQPLSCVNCTGNHPSLHNSCPEVAKRREISRVMAIHNVDYVSAKKIVEGFVPGPMTAPPGWSGNHFPRLGANNSLGAKYPGYEATPRGSLPTGFPGSYNNYNETVLNNANTGKSYSKVTRSFNY